MRLKVLWCGGICGINGFLLELSWNPGVKYVKCKTVFQNRMNLNKLQPHNDVSNFITPSNELLRHIRWLRELAPGWSNPTITQ